MIVDLIPCPDSMKKYINLVDTILRRKWCYKKRHNTISR